MTARGVFGTPAINQTLIVVIDMARFGANTCFRPDPDKEVGSFSQVAPASEDTLKRRWVEPRVGGEEAVKNSGAQKESKKKEARKKQKTEKEPDSKYEVQRRKKRKTQTERRKNLTE